MKRMTRYDGVKDSLGLSAFFVWFFIEILFNTTLKTKYSIVYVINDIGNITVLLMLLFTIVFLQNYEKKYFAIYIPITVLIGIATILSRNLSLLALLLFVIAFKGTDIKRIIRLAYFMLFIGLISTLMLNQIGIIDDYTIYRNGYLRHSLGFSHPNQLGLRVFQLIICHVYLRGIKLRFFDYVAIFALGIFARFIPNSQTAYICIYVLIFLLIINQILNKYRTSMEKLLGRILIGSYWLFNVGSVFLSIIDVKKYTVLSNLDMLISARFSECHRVYEMYGVSYLGQRVYVTEEERSLIGYAYRLWLDNSYMNLLIRYGIVVYVVFSIIYYRAMKSELNNGNYITLIVLFCYSLYGIMESGWFMLTHNLFLLLFSQLFMKSCASVKGLKIKISKSPTAV